MCFSGLLCVWCSLYLAYIHAISLAHSCTVFFFAFARTHTRAQPYKSTCRSVLVYSPHRSVCVYECVHSFRSAWCIFSFTHVMATCQAISTNPKCGMCAFNANAITTAATASKLTWNEYTVRAYNEVYSHSKGVRSIHSTLFFVGIQFENWN